MAAARTFHHCLMRRRDPSLLVLAFTLYQLLTLNHVIRAFSPSVVFRSLQAITSVGRQDESGYCPRTLMVHGSSTVSSMSTSSSPSLDHLRGDARGAALLLEDVSVYRGSAPILNSIHWRVEPRTKWALVGANGCGKSSTMKAVVGELPFEGKITIGVKGQVGYLQQTAVAGSNRTIYDEAASGMTAINRAREAMERSVAKGDLVALEKARTRFEALGGYQQEQKVASVLKGLGFTDMTKRCDALSGGWQMRVAFARLLLSEPALCLMDEPGNHLDAAAKKWLAKYLADYQGDGAMILVTHDVSLLQSMDHIAEIVPGIGSLQIYKSCTYNEYLELKEQRAAAAVAEFEKNVEKATKLQAFVDRFGASATKASAAQSRVKQLERMEREGLLDVPAQALVAQRFRPTLVLPNPPKVVGDVLLSLKSAAVGYDSPLISDINLDITKGMKLLVRGPNGAGKSTILHALRGTLPLIKGSLNRNPSLRLGMFTQDLAQELNPDERAADVATSYARDGPDGDITVTTQEARTIMGGLGLRGEKALRFVRDLSGGERARVCLAMFALKPSNLYLFDEVSNHLDVECVETLGNALSTWGQDAGAFVVVSHDRNFCEKIEFTHVATVRGGRLTLEQRSAVDSDWIINDLTETSQHDVASNAASKSEVSGAGLDSLDPKTRKLAFNAPKRIAKLEKLIVSVEERIASIDKEMLANGSDLGRLMEWTKEKEMLEGQVLEYLSEWEELEELQSLLSS